MSLDYTPITVANPPAQINVVEQRPSTPPAIAPSTSALLGGTTEVKATNQTNSNAATNNTEVNNRNTVIQNIRGAQTQVGDISFESTSFYANASTSINGDLEINAGIIVPLGGHKIRRAASSIARAKADAAKGGVCKSIMQAGFDASTVEAIYPNAPEYKKCVRLVEVVATVKNNQDELDVLKLEVAELKLKLAQTRGRHSQPVPREHPQNKEVRGLW